MCVRPLVAFSYKATITISKKNKEVLIYLASVSTDPELFVLPTLSLPAKSTKWSLDLLIMSDPMIEIECSGMVIKEMWDIILTIMVKIREIIMIIMIATTIIEVILIIVMMMMMIIIRIRIIIVMMIIIIITIKIVITADIIIITKMRVIIILMITTTMIIFTINHNNNNDNNNNNDSINN